MPVKFFVFSDRQKEDGGKWGVRVSEREQERKSEKKTGEEEMDTPFSSARGLLTDFFSVFIAILHFVATQESGTKMFINFALSLFYVFRFGVLYTYRIDCA